MLYLKTTPIISTWIFFAVAASADKTFRQALASFQAGDLPEAERAFKKLLDVDPGHVAGLNLFAILLTRVGRLQEAERHIRRALNENVESDITLNNYGIILGALGKPEDALDKFSRALAIMPSNADTWHSRGASYLQLRQFQEAIADFDKAISLNPKFIDAFCNKGASLRALHLADQSLAAYDKALALNSGYSPAWLGRGLTLLHLNRCVEALAAYEKAATLNPNMAEAWLGQGNALYELKRYKDAASAYDKAIVLQPTLISAWIGGGNIFLQLKYYNKALAAYDKALELDAMLPDGWVGRGNVLYETKRYTEAAAAYDKALELAPDLVSAWMGRGNVLAEIRRDDEADKAYDHVIAVRPDLANGWAGRGGVFLRLLRDDDAIACYQKAISIDPDYAEPYFNMAIIKLSHGNFEEGWPLYEWRWKTRIRAFSDRHFTQKLWLGADNITGKTILVHAEQGLGDTVQFCRYLEKLEALNCKIIFEVPAALYELFAAQHANYKLIRQGETIPDFEFHCPLMSMPLAFKTTMKTVPASIPYLAAPPEKIALWQSTLGRRNRPRIGLCWSGSPGSTNDVRRSIPLELLAPILSDNLEWHSLQKEVREHDRPPLSASTIVDHASGLKDFTDTAALVAAMDIVISADAVAGHLAGALGKPLWSLQPLITDFRWMRDRDDSPWYPNAKLFRQKKDGDWSNVLESVRQALDSYIFAK
jgi:tetratricopeptide (TPR) repeat protein